MAKEGTFVRIQENGKHFVLYFMLGFCSGILYANLFAKEYIISMGILSEYFLNQYSADEIQMGEYLWYVARIRLAPLLLLGALGCTKLRKGVVAAFILWTGFSSGLLFTSAVIKMGVKGIILFLIAFVPQFLFYAAGYLALLWYLYTYPQIRWNLAKTVIFLLLLLVGILLECYVNPVIMQMFIRTL